jgi:hypothetical protein
MKKSQKAILLTAIFLLSTFGLSIQAVAKTRDAPSQDYYPFRGQWGACADIEHRMPKGIIKGVFDDGCLYGIINFDYNTYGIISAQYKEYKFHGTMRIINARFKAFKEPLELVYDIDGNFNFYNPHQFIMHLNIDCEDYGNFKNIPKHQCIWIDGFPL